MKKILASVVLPLVIILAWWFMLKSGMVPNSLVATPGQVVAKLMDMVQDGSIFVHSFVSIKRLLVGFVIGTTSGIIVGTMVGFWRSGSAYLEPTLLALLPIPPIAWIPFLIIIFGIDEASKIALISMGSFWTLFLQTSHGIRSTDKGLVEVGYIFKKSWRTILFKIMLPSCLPNIFAGMRVALAISWGLLVASEIIASSEGIGWLIWNARNFSRPAELMVGMIFAGLLGALTDRIIVITERKCLKWRSTYNDFI